MRGGIKALWMPGRHAKRGRAISNVLVLLAAATWFDSALSLSPTTTAFVPSTTAARGFAAASKLQVYPALTGCRGVAGSRRDLALRAESKQWCASASEEGPRQSSDLPPKLSNTRRQAATAALMGIPAWASLSTAAAAAATEPQHTVAAAHLLSQAASASVTVDALVGGMLAGAVAGAAVDLALYPIDTIKTRLQTIGSIQLEAGEWRQLYSGGTSCSSLNPPPPCGFV
jgi:hypothetical protein